MAMPQPREQEPEIRLARFEQADRHLRRAMPFTPLLFMSVGAIIGSGWLFAELAAAGIAGPASVVSWVIGGIFLIFVALNYAEISSALPRTGAIVRYPHLTHGAYTGWIMGWGYWLSAVSVPAIEAEAVVQYLGGAFRSLNLVTKGAGGVEILSWPNGIGVGVGLMLLFFFLNFFGIKLLSEVNRWIVWWKIVIPVTTFCFLFTILRGSNFTAFGGFNPMGTGAVLQALPLSGIIFAYLGFRQALDYAGEARNPQRHVPLATVLSIVIAMAIYVGLQIGFIGALRWGAAGVHPGDWSGLTGSPWASGPLYNALTAAGIASLAAFGTVLLIDAGVSPSGTGWIYVGTSARTYYGLSVDGYFPRTFQWMNRWGIPWVSAVGAFVIGCVFFIPTPSWYKLVGFITSATVLTYIMGGLGLPVMRRTAPNLPRPFRLPWAWLWSPVGFLAALMIVYWSGFTTLNNVFAAVFIGLPLFAWFYAPARGWVDRRAAAVLGAVFLGAWIYINMRGGWTLTISGGRRAGSWSFPMYDIAFSAAVVFFCVALWALSNREGRLHVRNTAWLIWLLLATFPLSYWGNYGPAPHLRFPWDTLVEVGVGLVTFYWGVASGFLTQEMRELSGAVRALKEPGEPGAA